MAEAKARDLLDRGQDAITCESVYQLIKQSQLPPQTKHRAAIESADTAVTTLDFRLLVAWRKVWDYDHHQTASCSDQGAHMSSAEAGADVAMGFYDDP